MKDIQIARFEQILPRYAHYWERSLRGQYAKAKDKEYIKGEVRQAVNEVFWSLCNNAALQGIIGSFLALYKKGEPPTTIFQQLAAQYNAEKIVTEREKELHGFLADEKQALKLFIRCAAYQEIEWKLPSILNGEPLAAAPSPGSPLQWVSAGENKNEFVQLAYALYHAGYLRTDSGEITKIVETLASLLNVSLGKNWQSNHSASVHNVCNDYEPPIFNKIKSAYLRYSSDKIEAKRQNK